MAFKSDRSFLDKVTMGAKGAIQAKRILAEHGHQIIELERYSTSNKIWSTKVKRLRVPDLLCLRCGRRMEVRSKSALKITMSDSPTVIDRQWDYGLRDQDLVLLIACKRDPQTSEWVPSDVINAFAIRDLRATVGRSRLGPPKSASEGAERDRTWPSYVPPFDGLITGVTPQFISMVKPDGRQQTYSLTRGRFHAHVRNGARFQADSTIVASVVPQMAHLDCTGDTYDFAADLGAPDRETLYCAVKALGRLPEVGRTVVTELLRIAEGGCADELVQLEACASLARLGADEGWAGLERFLGSENVEARMEAVLILDELNTPRATALLLNIAGNRANDSEVRAAAVWGIGHHTHQNPVASIIPFLDEQDRFIAVHAIAASIPHINAETLPILLRELGPHDRSASIVRAIVESSYRDANLIVRYLFEDSRVDRQAWLLYLLGQLGEEVSGPALRARGTEGERVASSLMLFWNQHRRNWTNTFEVEDLLDYTIKQNVWGAGS